jgi:hypothetical protein
LTYVLSPALGDMTEKQVKAFLHGDLAEAIANPTELELPEGTPRPELKQTQDDPPEDRAYAIGVDRDPGTPEENAEYLAERFDYASDEYGSDAPSQRNGQSFNPAPKTEAAKKPPKSTKKKS